MDKFERFDKFEKLDRKVEETIREVETMDRRKFYRNSFVCAGVWALLLNLVIETLGRFPTVGIFGGLSFMVHSPLVFLYNALILYATLVLASLFKRRVFFLYHCFDFLAGHRHHQRRDPDTAHDAVHRKGSEQSQ